METKKGIGLNPLLEARQEALKSAESIALRPLGKLWGMDVFTWYAPNIHELAATLSTFPFPVYWMGTQSQFLGLAKADPDTMRSLAWCAQFDHAQLSIPSDVLRSIPLVTGNETLEEALIFLKNTAKSKHILMFTVEGNEWKTKMKDFETFVKENQ